MSASVSVGFAPATSPLISTGVTAAPDAAPGGEDASPFAILLSLLGNQLAEATGETGIALPKELADNPLLASLTTVATELPALATADPSVLAQGLDTVVDDEAANTLLKDLAAALTAISDALETGKPLDPALEDKLADNLDAVAALLGIPLPQPTTATATAGEIPAIDAVAAPAAPSSGNLPELPPSADDAPEPVDDAGAAADMQARPVPEVLARLGAALAELATRLEAQAPALAKAVAGLGERLAAGDLPDEILAAIGVPRQGETTNKDLLQLVAALTAPKPAAAGIAPAQPIAAPSLGLPDLATPDGEAPRAANAGDAVATTRFTPLADARPDDKPAPEAKPAVATSRPADLPAPASTSADPAALAVAAPPTAAAAPAARAVHAAYQAPVQQVNLPQVAFELARQVEAGNTRFQIRLDPPELGRIDVRLDLDGSGTVNARMVVERAETLDLMQRDQRALQQALQQAGLDATKTNLEFSLRQNPFARDFGGGDGRGQPSGFAGPDQGGTGDAAAPPASTTLYRGTATAGGVNLFV